ncbi:MAG: histidine kinase [Bacteroidia bacterium]|nr:histidine kinase [Bacteroidia bacterium]
MDSPFGKRIQLAFWILLLTFNIYLGSFALGLQDALFRAVLNVACHLINFYGFYSLIIPRYYEKKNHTLAVAGALVLVATLTPIRMYIENQFTLTGQLAQRLGETGRLAFVLFTEIAIGGFASLMRLAVNNEINKRRLIELSRSHAESELRFLKAQMNPHFLFNTINNIYSLSLVKSDRTPEALMKLSELLRYMLYETNEQVPLAKEVTILHDYAHLFQLRYENPLHLTISTEVRTDASVEPLVLVPILENALKHSGLGINDRAFVIFSLEEVNRTLVVQCTNSRTDVRVKDEPGGIGLSNITKRLELVYPGRHQLIVNENASQFEMRLTIQLT